MLRKIRALSPRAWKAWPRFRSIGVAMQEQALGRCCYHRICRQAAMCWPLLPKTSRTTWLPRRCTLKWSRDRRTRFLLVAAGAALATCGSVAAVRPFAHVHALLFKPGEGFERWIENVSSGSDIEKALFRVMQLPGGDVLFRRAPGETVPALTELQQRQKTTALYSLRALEEEQKLDFAAAERDWKTWADQADDRLGAHLDLADFYERRLQPQAELAALEVVGNAGPDPHERWTAVEAQRSWRAFEHTLKVVDEYALQHSESARIYAAWIKRYPQERSVYARQFAFLLAEKDFQGASAAIARYGAAFPD